MIVVDASTVVAALVDENEGEAARHRIVAAAQRHAPYLLHLEVGNALRKLVLRAGASGADSLPTLRGGRGHTRRGSRPSTALPRPEDGGGAEESSTRRRGQPQRTAFLPELRQEHRARL